MASRRRVILEVERKFRGLAVPELTRHAGHPPFRRLQPLPGTILHDAYYDRGDILSTAGAWVRLRNGAWEAKVRKGGDFRNSRFEELQGPQAVAACIQRITGCSDADMPGPACHFGLLPMATFVTERQAWRADDEFSIVLDTMDFGHAVGEVELMQTLDIEEDNATGGSAAADEARKSRAMAEMDARIASFMETYSWAFLPGKPTGKLTAYFEWLRAGGI